MKRLRNIVLAASLLMGGWQAAMAEDLTIAGLGTLPLDSRISITDGKDNVMMDLFKKETKKRGYGKTARVLMWSMLAVPPGMNLYPEKAPYPYDSLHLYQLVKRTVSGTYTAPALRTISSMKEAGRPPFSGGMLSGKMPAALPLSSACPRFPLPSFRDFWMK